MSRWAAVTVGRVEQPHIPEGAPDRDGDVGREDDNMLAR